jgi:hypothetical protein
LITYKWPSYSHITAFTMRIARHSGIGIALAKVWVSLKKDGGCSAIATPVQVSVFFAIVNVRALGGGSRGWGAGSKGVQRRLWDTIMVKSFHLQQQWKYELLLFKREQVGSQV